MASSDNQNVTTLRLLRRRIYFWGAYTRVAKRLGISRQFVAQVARGEKKSKRVIVELVREMKRLDRKKAA
jgi:hypothetical protein